MDQTKIKAQSSHLLASQDLDTYTGIHEHTHRTGFHAYGAVIVCPNPSIIDYYALIRLISYLRNPLKGQLAKTLHLVVCVDLCVFLFLYIFVCVYLCIFIRISLCMCLCVCTPLWDISIGRPILSSLWVDFKGEEISAGFSRLVNSLSPESGVFLSCVRISVCAYLTLDSVCVCVCVHAPMFMSSNAYTDCQSTDVWLLKRHLLKDQLLHCGVCACTCVHVCVYEKNVLNARFLLYVREHACIYNCGHLVC